MDYYKYFSILYKSLKHFYFEKNISHVFRHSIKVFQMVDILIKKSNKSINSKQALLGAILHDIGRMADMEHPLQHGIIGCKLISNDSFFDFLEKHTRKAISQICSNHIGCGITKDDIIKQKLPLPISDYTPKTIEELLVSFSDNLFAGEKLMGINYVIKRFTTEISVEYEKRILKQIEILKEYGINTEFLY